MFNKQLQVVQTTQFKRPYRNCGSLMQHIEVMESRNIDELILLDIDATQENRGPDFDVIKEVCNELFCPVTYGGGIKTLDHVNELIQRCGVDKVAIKAGGKTSISSTINKYGSQAVVGVVDFNVDYVPNCIVLLKPVIDNLSTLQKIGLGEVLLTAIRKNGTQSGYDLFPLKYCKSLSIPIIINGGCGHPDHMVEAIKAGVSAVAASSMFLFSSHTPKSCAKALHEAGVLVRLHG